MARGFFITLEGVEGSGKTTQARRLADALSERGYPVLLTREPGATALGGALRGLLLDSQLRLEPAAELLLMLADRAQHVREQLQPALAASQIVVSDRYSDSTTAYQGYGRGFDLKLLSELNRLAAADTIPDFTVVLDCAIELGLARTRKRQTNAGAADRFESERSEFHQRVRDGFLAIARAESGRVTVLDSSRPLEQVAAEILHLTIQRIGAR